MPLPRVGLEERGTPMLDARTARILAKENEKGYEARWRREMVERCETYISRDGEGRTYTQARASEWVPFFMMYMWIPVLLPM